MASNKSYFDIGSEIEDTVNRAINNNNYDNLNNELARQIILFSEAVRQAQAESQMRAAERRERAMEQERLRRQREAEMQRAQEERMQNYDFSRRGSRTTVLQQQPNALNKYYFKTPPKYGNATLKMIVGILGILTFVPALMAASLVTSGAAMSAAADLILSLVCIYLTASGVSERKLIDKYYKYGRALGKDEEYISLQALANVFGEDKAETVKNFEKMIKKKFLGTARFDIGKDNVLLTPRAYEEYAKSEEARKKQEAEAAAEQKAREGLSDEVKEILKEGEAYIAEVRRCNDLIPDEEMTKKLSKLEGTVNKIFDRVKEHPENAKELRKLMSYYLPTTKKLLNAYIDLDNQPQVGTNITNTKREIEAAMDTINDAFENLLDSLFEDVAWDISSDISVMNTMMEQDGLRR
jgi:hypothetical protein